MTFQTFKKIYFLPQKKSYFIAPTVGVLAVWWMVELQEGCLLCFTNCVITPAAVTSQQPASGGRRVIIIITLHTLYSVTCPHSVWFEVSCIGDTEHVLLAQ